eukprot:2409119-Amphidinium_carterae.1
MSKVPRPLMPPQMVGGVIVFPLSLHSGEALCASEFAKELAAALRSPIIGRDRHCRDPDPAQ